MAAGAVGSGIGFAEGKMVGWNLGTDGGVGFGF